MRRSRKPEGHTLYWTYINYQNGDYNFGTSTQKVEAMATAAEFRREADWKDVIVFYGDGDGAFTQLDPVASWYRSA